MQFNNSAKQKRKIENMKTLHLKKSISRSPLRLGLLLIPLVLACFALLPSVRATPDPGAVGGGNSNAADGFGALNATVSGINNSGFGANALHNLTTGNNNAAQGNSALNQLTDGSNNTALGVLALRLNVHGDANTAVGKQALNNNTASFNVAVGYQALFGNTTGNDNTANGVLALSSNKLGFDNTAVGFDALGSYTGGAGVLGTDGYNTAVGSIALTANIDGHNNTAVGRRSFENSLHGTDLTGLGWRSGDAVTSASNVICIGSFVVGENVPNTAYIGNIYNTISSGGIGVFVNSAGKLGTSTSSRRFKDEIKPMDKASEAILALKPVTFFYKKEIEPQRVPQFGLVAEDVEKVNPDLVVRDAEGKVNSVRYDQVNAMLLNEFLKEHRTVQEQGATIAELRKGMEVLAATVKEQAAQIQKVSAVLEVSKPAPRTVLNNQ
jgi:hypothetical protein